MIPAHEPSTGNLPPGEHLAEWVDVVERFGTTPWRRQLLEGLARALRDLRAAGCKRAYIAPVATSNSPICGQVKFPQARRQERKDCYSESWPFTRRRAASFRR